VWLQILAFIVAMTGTVMLLYRDPDISPQIWNCSLVLASVAAAAIFKVSVYRTSPHERFCRLRRFWSVLALSVTAETHKPTLAADICRVVLARVFRPLHELPCRNVAGCVSTVLQSMQQLPDGILPRRSRSVSLFSRPFCTVLHVCHLQAATLKYLLEQYIYIFYILGSENVRHRH